MSTSRSEEENLWNAASTTLLHSIPNGTFTITSPIKANGHRTFRISTVQKGTLKGKRILSLLAGPDNENDYWGFAFVQVIDSADRFVLWRRYANQAFYTWCADLLAELIPAYINSTESEFMRRGYILQMSKRCLKCNRTLTDPISIQLGIGPQCRAGGTDHD